MFHTTMVDRRLNEIRTVAELPFLIYGNGYTAQIVRMKSGKDKNNHDVVDFILKPSDKMVSFYNIPAQEDGTVIVMAQYPYDMLLNMNSDPANNRWLYVPDYEGNISPEMSKFLGISLLEQIRKLKEENEMLRQKLEVSEEQRRLLEQDLPKYIHQNFGILIKEFEPIIDKFVARKPNE